MKLVENGRAVPILVESGAFEGVRRIADTVAEDICLVTGEKPEILSELVTGGENLCDRMIFCATLGRSPLLDELKERGLLDVGGIQGKREVFCLRLVENPFDGVKQALVICGSDKRGTIYGMFTLSEYLGVTPLLYWGDAAPARRPGAEIGRDIEMTSREPSVRYRGFFINDEWPCFGTWVTTHFGDFNANAYKYIFEFLLRMKGNYMWPAMWTASFPLDGPGSANEELADIYGVIMGYSHHEPCLRASEEWDKVRGEGTRYGNEWNFYTNEQGLLNYWEDSLKRSGCYENIITIGMRGERDSSMLGEDATVEENVNLLKNIIRKQNGLIKKYVNEDLSRVPRMLALYKEVEAYFYGDEATAGLKDWEELDGVICMLCEDNFGHMRTLPTEEIRNHKGGFGMYYHFDYHGGPVSYEWLDSTPLSKTWEQMCTAYEYGIRDLWIVNVGDLKLHEVPLTYFMALAYDFEKWGSSNPESYRQFAEQWAKTCFPEADCKVQKAAAKVFTDYIDLAQLRRPESLNEAIYHPCHYLEADRMLERALETEKLSEEVMSRLPAEERDGYYSMVHFSASAFTNLLKMQLYAAKNHHYAKQGRSAANRYGALVRECMEKDRRFGAEFAAFKDGKWSGMQLAPHIGFTKWNEDGCKYPYVCSVEPVGKPRLSVSRADEERVYVKNYGNPEVIEVSDFLFDGCESVFLEVCNDGIGTLEYRIEAENNVWPEWLEVNPRTGVIKDIQRITIRCFREKLTPQEQSVRLLVTDGETNVAVEVQAGASQVDEASVPECTWMPSKDGIIIAADGFCHKKDTEKGAFRVLAGYGKYGSAVKVFPPTADFAEDEEAPELTYRFLIREAGRYRVELLTAPTNSAVNRRAVRMKVRTSEGEEQTIVLVPEDFRAGDHRDERWCRGVLDQIRLTALELAFDEGVQSLTLGALESGAVPERIRIYKASAELPESYLGPELSKCGKTLKSKI
ncbi:MAG: glycosyl hydrolase 115 family protein [Acetatifactor sp.]